MKKLLIVSDYQNDFVTGTLGFEDAVKISGGIRSKIAEYRENGSEIIFIMDTHEEGYLDTQEGRNLPVIHCVEGSHGWQICDSIADLMRSSDKIFKKPVFGSADLMDYLMGKSYESVELVGVVTNICVISNAVITKTALPETPVIVDARCVASNDREAGEKALDVMESFQVKVIGR